MLVKNIFSNPLHGIKPGEIGELPKNRESRIDQYVKYGMIELAEEVQKAEEGEPTEEIKKKPRGRGRRKESDK